ncbi:MAG: hypothetical protein ACLTXT_02900 [Ruminococcus callidus]
MKNGDFYADGRIDALDLCLMRQEILWKQDFWFIEGITRGLMALLFLWDYGLVLAFEIGLLFDWECGIMEEN